MRITSGHAWGMKLNTPPGEITRPTAEKIRQAVFNIIGQDITGAVFIDIFAGSGAMGLEAASRGADRVIWIESHPAAISCLEKNKQELLKRFKKQDLKEPRCELIKRPAEAWIKKPSPGFIASFIWLDPPYDQTLTWLNRFQKDLVSLSGEHTILIVEMNKKDLKALEEALNPWKVLKSKTYGSSSVVFASL